MAKENDEYLGVIQIRFNGAFSVQKAIFDHCIHHPAKTKATAARDLMQLGLETLNAQEEKSDPQKNLKSQTKTKPGVKMPIA